MFSNIHLNPFAISNLILFLTCFFLFIIVFFYGKNKTARIYCLFVISVGIWGGGGFLGSITNSPVSSLFWYKVSYCGVIFIPIFFIHTVLLFTSTIKNSLLLFSYFLGIIFGFLNIQGFILKDVQFVFNSFYYGQGGLLAFVSFIFWFLLAFLGHYILVKFYIRVKEKQYLFFFFSVLCGFTGGTMNFLPLFNLNVYPFGNFLISFYSVVIAYAIFKYQIFEINVIVQKGFIYSFLIALITATYLIFVLLAEKLFQGMVGYTSLFISILYAFVIALFFTPVKNKIQHLADKIFLGKDPLQIAQENELMKQELERSERLKAVAHFASGMAHEIKNPLTAIKTFTEYLPEKKNDPEFLNKFSKIVANETDRIDSLVHQLLDFAKPTPLKLEEVDIHKLLDETLDLLSNDLIKHNIKAIKEYSANLNKSNANTHELISDNSCSISENLCLIRVDPNRMKQAFLNIFLNAIEAMPSGGTLTVNTFIRVNSRSEEFALIRVEDTGVGIAEKDLKHIFEPFYSTKEKGTGLGLSIVYNIIKEHGGSIKAETKVGEGTKFTIALPIIIK